MFNLFLFVKTHPYQVSVVGNDIQSRLFKNKADQRDTISILLGNIYFLKAENLNSHFHSVIFDE